MNQSYIPSFNVKKKTGFQESEKRRRWLSGLGGPQLSHHQGAAAICKLRDACTLYKFPFNIMQTVTNV